MAVDEFFVFLGVGLAILIFAVVIFSLIQPEEQIIPRFEEKLVVRNARFAFESSNLRAHKTSSLGTIELHNGLLFGKKEYEFNLASKDIEQLQIDMSVKRTNSYGRLSVKANDNVLINDKLLLGDYSIPVSKQMFNGHVLIEIEPESSSWRIWAPTLYEVEASLDYVTFDKRTDEFMFTLGNETDTLKYVKISFILDKNIGDLIVDVNGNVVFAGPADKLQQIDVDTTLVNKGANTVRFEALEDSFYSGQGVVNIGYTQLMQIE